MNATRMIDNKAKIAYLILIHRYPKQFFRFFKAIYHPDNYYLIHVDKKASGHLYRDIECFLTDYSNSMLLKREEVNWGGFSMVQVELNGIKKLLDLYADWDFCINLSGQDFPLKSQDYIRNFLSVNRNKNFIKIANQAIDRPETMYRIENYFNESIPNFHKSQIKRPFLDNVIPYIGGQWWILTRTCCEFFSYSHEVDKFVDYYRNTFVPDESFFQTVIMNTSLNEMTVLDDKRAIIWEPIGDIKLRPKTLTQNDKHLLLNGDNLFARKFDENIDSEILEILENYLTTNYK